mmetsp:Transcript_24709/g.34060  ORF Transcript_24709/g.34060 Transcript_24709/m.34060 type:complete len:429 (-) Transcript_24709:198-1484(-)
MSGSYFVGSIAKRFRSGFEVGARNQWRTIGREAEHPIVCESTGESFDIRKLWPYLKQGSTAVDCEPCGLEVAVRTPHYDFTAEVGTGLMEIVTQPGNTLQEVEEKYESGMVRLIAAAKEEGALVLGYGIQPLSAGSDALMMPKQRYHALRQVLGGAWLPFTVTAADQVHVSILQSEILPLTNVCNLLAPVVVALCGNSSVYAGQQAGVCSARMSLMADTQRDHPHRHAMPGRAHSSLEDMVSTLASHKMLLAPSHAPLINGNLFDYLQDVSCEDAQMEAFLMHEHYVWHSARPRSKQGTLEMRAACQQPWSQRHAAAALNVGLVCAAEQLEEIIEAQFGGVERAWPKFQEYLSQVVQHGLAADEPCEGFLLGVLEACAESLQARGKGEDEFLQPLWERLRKRSNPAQDVALVFEEGGIKALMRHTICQ